MESRLEDIASKYLTTIMPSLQKVITLQKKGIPFKRQALKLIMEAEESIPGAGVHYSIIKGDCYRYPADYRYQGVVRPLRYSLSELGTAYTGHSSVRYSIQTSGGHLEGCMKVLLGWPRNRKPLGSLIKTKKAQKVLGKDLAEDMTKLTNLAVNPAKHEYTNRDGLDPVFQFPDALYAHFLARHFGAIILRKANILGYIESLEPMAGQMVQCFPGAALSISHDD